ncbi:putative metalloprotease CJM1_0395 family protein [Thauera aminoaromatica]|uniref:putative metalloprotease CJM1_0395 family protein n=1 Tax=Thauera aminoaromatica TaxID=164330 RepID=UPI002357288B|nr:putative metalloprotease CJM1_0395 family protein [Thauera aminoaromatica]MCK6398171.1 hypothetical protein [Thauera aminoaromatica]
MSAMSISLLGGGDAAWRQATAMNAARPAGASGGAATAGAGGEAREAGAGAADTLSEAEQRQVAELAERDREVRAHEMAHVAAGAGLVTRGASYTYQTGPDGQRYAIGGEVGIDTSPGRSPEESLSKAERIRAAALAPAEPSGQDRQVAAQASRMASDARMEIARREFEQGGAGAEAAATRDGPGYRGMRAAQAYSAAFAPGQGPTLSATA